MQSTNDVTAAWVECSNGVAMMHVTLRNGAAEFMGERFPVDVTTAPVGAVAACIRYLNGNKEGRREMDVKQSNSSVAMNSKGVASC